MTRVEDRRGQGGFGGGLRLPTGRGAGVGLGGLGIIGVVLALVFTVFTGGTSGFDVGVPQIPGLQAAPAGQDGPSVPDPDAARKELVVDVADDTQAMWSEVFQQAGRTYQAAGLVIFSGGTVSGCGPASSATGPFYCPADQKVYIDLGFFDDLRERFGAAGDFAEAYVIAHEIGHHVQTLLGTNEAVQRLSRQDPDDANALSVRLELQADCYAGVWGHTVYAQGELQQGDVEEAIGAAAAIGDDRIQTRTSGRIDPESWTHGSSEQRVKWFEKGFDGGDPGACDSFSGDA